MPSAFTRVRRTHLDRHVLLRSLQILRHHPGPQDHVHLRRTAGRTAPREIARGGEVRSLVAENDHFWRGAVEQGAYFRGV